MAHVAEQEWRGSCKLTGADDGRRVSRNNTCIGPDTLRALPKPLAVQHQGCRWLLVVAPHNHSDIKEGRMHLEQSPQLELYVTPCTRLTKMRTAPNNNCSTVGCLAACCAAGQTHSDMCPLSSASEASTCSGGKSSSPSSEMSMPAEQTRRCALNSCCSRTP